MSYIIDNPDVVWSLLVEHVKMTAVALLVAMAVALPLGMLTARYRWLSMPVMSLLGILYTVPSLALIILLVPVFGLNATSVIVALVLYTQVILVRNIAAGLQSIDPQILEAARGMGMNAWQRWWRIELPLALPIILAGLRIAAIVAIAIAAIGAKFGAGGLGTLLFEGIAQTGRYDKIWAGAIALAILALAVNGALIALERAFDAQVRIRRAERRSRWTLGTLDGSKPL